MTIHDVLCLAREMGLTWLGWRALYEVELRSGILRRQFKPQSINRLLAKSLGVTLENLDHHLWESWQGDGSRFFLVPDVQHYDRNITCPEKVLQVANAALEGRLLFFGRWWADLGDPPDWLLNPVNGVHYSDVHWALIPDLSPRLGDIKYVWEASRFPQAYYFVRAYALTGDERYAEGFWNHVEAWTKANRPELGPNWRCGQEIALRSLAWVFALYAFRRSRATTPERVSLMLKYLWYQARHIEKIHWYAARCVRNNHAISEAAGLFTIGVLFPFLPGADRWRAKGYRFLVQEAMWQIYDDGSYVQHSMNYARLVVQLFTWCLRLGQVNGIDFPEPLKDRLRKLVNFLRSMQDPETGRVPNYGANDGALIFPLSSCDYLDYRPALNALSIVVGQGKLYGPGPWDEEATWFCGPECLVVEQGSREDAGNMGAGYAPTAATTGRAFPTGGYYVLRSSYTFGMIRCGRHRHRPSQADMLHLDVWYSGCNVLVDPGTFSYNLRPPWSGYFVGTASHNTVTVDDKDQMKRGSRFVWLNWVHGRTIQFRAEGRTALFVGEHFGYTPVVHRRLVALHEDVWVVIDDLFGDAACHTYALHWLVGDFNINPASSGGDIRLITSGGNELQLALRVACTHQGEASWVRGDEEQPRGWQSLYYGEKIPAWSYLMKVVNCGPVRFATVLGPEDRIKKYKVSTVDEITRLLKSWDVDVPALEASVCER